MKNLLFILFFSFLSISALSAQVKAVGFHKTEIIEQFESITEDTTEDGMLYWVGLSEDKSLKFIMYFNQEGICTLAFIVPETSADLNNLIGWCNEKYTVVSDSEWKSYGTVAIVSISLQSINNQLVFLCALAKKF
jgi:hypothetical protein